MLNSGWISFFKDYRLFPINFTDSIIKVQFGQDLQNDSIPTGLCSAACLEWNQEISSWPKFGLKVWVFYVGIGNAVIPYLTANNCLLELTS